MNLSISIQKLKRFIVFPASEKIWLIIAVVCLGLVRLMILLLPFRWLFPFLGTHYQNIAVSLCVTEQQQLLASRIGQIIEIAARTTPWQSKCLVQAIVAKMFLSYYQLPYLFYFGLNKEGSGDLQAHAWVCSGRVAVTGGCSFTHFTIVSTFGSKDVGVIPHINNRMQ